MKYIKELSTESIKTKIESAQGRNNKGGDITHCVDQLSFRFNKWKTLALDLEPKILNEIEKVNNTLTTLSLGFYSDKKQKFVATLSLVWYILWFESSFAIDQYT